MRGDRFTVEEMMLIGKTVAEIRATRDSLRGEVQSEDHQEKTD
ncbi:hypothetical protein UFOVP749_48 [uncultured Caudovirales phage]|uniref:Uncharacterized protein n=1 Tax=uncultured Caudovirales phage TaxID=2100421 RepID=A0A6J7X515_9CAUD|nr:hypothetical protein UFOVP749_48 [uncultured Caudovirales phage]